MDVRGIRIGTCVLEGVVGKGGSADVYRAIQEPLQRPVAVKALRWSEDLHDSETRFRREAIALGKLHHENIVEIHDLVEHQGRLYMVLELIEGPSIATLLKDGPMPIGIALLVGSKVASALEHAHFRKIIHRDVKPSNVMLSLTGDVKLTDFGLAKNQRITGMTKAGILVGTPSYLSPEQLKTDAPPDHRSDIYALGVMLYEVLSGEKPFPGPLGQELFDAIMIGRRKPLRAVVPDLPKTVEKIVDRCMAVDPEKRYSRAAEIRRDLEQYLHRELPGTPSAQICAYLKELGYIRDDALESLDVADLEESSAFFQRKARTKTRPGVDPRKRTNPLDRLDRGVAAMLALLAVLIVAAGVGVYWAFQRGIISVP